MDRPANFCTKKWTFFGLCLFSIVQLIVLSIVVREMLRYGLGMTETVTKALIAIFVVSIITIVLNVNGLIICLLEKRWLTLIFIVLNSITGLLFFLLSCIVPNIWAIAATSIVTTVVAIAFYRDLKLLTSFGARELNENDSLIE